MSEFRINIWCEDTDNTVVNSKLLPKGLELLSLVKKRTGNSNIKMSDIAEQDLIEHSATIDITDAQAEQYPCFKNATDIDITVPKNYINKFLIATVTGPHGDEDQRIFVHYEAPDEVILADLNKGHLDRERIEDRL